MNAEASDMNESRAAHGEGSGLHFELDVFLAAMDAALAAGDAQAVQKIQRERARVVRRIPAGVCDPAVRARLLERALAEDREWIGRAGQVARRIHGQIDDVRAERQTRKNLAKAYAPVTSCGHIVSHKS